MIYLFRLRLKALWAKQSIKVIRWVVRHLMRQSQDGISHSEDERYVQARILFDLDARAPEWTFFNELFQPISNSHTICQWWKPLYHQPTIDPHGFLQQASLMFDSIHLKDNCVLYYEQICKDEWVLSPETCLTGLFADLQLQHTGIYWSRPISCETRSNHPAAVCSRNHPMSRSHPGTGTYQVSAKLGLCVSWTEVSKRSVLIVGFLDCKVNNLTCRNLNYL